MLFNLNSNKFQSSLAKKYLPPLMRNLCNLLQSLENPTRLSRNLILESNSIDYPKLELLNKTVKMVPLSISKQTSSLIGLSKNILKFLTCKNH